MGERGIHRSCSLMEASVVIEFDDLLTNSPFVVYTYDIIYLPTLLGVERVGALQS